MFPRLPFWFIIGRPSYHHALANQLSKFRAAKCIFQESDFDLNWKRDRYGRQVIQNPEENLNRFYRIREEKAKKSAILDSKKGY